VFFNSFASPVLTSFFSLISPDKQLAHEQKDKADFSRLLLRMCHICRVWGENIVFSWQGLDNVACSAAKPINTDPGIGNATRTGHHARKRISSFSHWWIHKQEGISARAI